MRFLSSGERKGKRANRVLACGVEDYKILRKNLAEVLGKDAIESDSLVCEKFFQR
ncbi:hypothetical protein HSHS1_06160 [Helicobacter suis HS1]|nr:hypothetical protein HSHS1_06160 [Helicobacter suis HS1]